MGKDLLEKRIREEINKCQDTLRHKKVGEGKNGFELYCNLDIILGCPIECPYQGRIVWVEKKTSSGTLRFPYHSCSHK